MPSSSRGHGWSTQMRRWGLGSRVGVAMLPGALALLAAGEDRLGRAVATPASQRGPRVGCAGGAASFTVGRRRTRPSSGRVDVSEGPAMGRPEDYGGASPFGPRESRS